MTTWTQTVINEKRPCQFKTLVSNKWQWTLGCIFHGWGVDYTEFETGTGNSSVGIVEDPDGNIFMPRADNVFFTDRQKKE